MFASYDASPRGCGLVALLMLASASLVGCGGHDQSDSASAGAPAVEADLAGITFVASTPGVSPFIASVAYRALNLPIAVRWTIAAKPGSASKPVKVTYSIDALQRQGYVTKGGFGGNTLRIPVYGLYAAYANQVSIAFEYSDSSVRTEAVAITTGAYDDPTGIYQQPTVLKQRAVGSSLGFDFFIMKSAIGPPVIMDSDAEVRWAVPSGPEALSSTFQNDEFVIGDSAHPIIHRLNLDGTLTSSSTGYDGLVLFHHNIDPGKVALLTEVNTQIGGVYNGESTIAEMTDVGGLVKLWDFAQILRDYMQSQGDDAGSFVRPGTDWFHNNASVYDPSDDTLIVSSRENFIMKIDYATGKLLWIFGDPTKYWFTFPSLRAKSLTLAAGGLYPIGQHALSINSDGDLMLFNDGFGSQSQPAGQSAGQTRTFSEVSAYSIDPVAMTAVQTLSFDYGKTIYSSVCSSVYEGAAKSLLVDYAVADSFTHARLVGLNADQEVIFDYQYPTVNCNTSWNALPIALDNLTVN